MQRVAVLGAGVAGMTAADELSQRNFEVDVFERRAVLGGKARSFPSRQLPSLGTLPAEHGFRFLPGFYWHLPETMRGIPYRGNSSVYDNLVDARHIALLRSGKPPVTLPTSSLGFLDPDDLRFKLTRHPFTDNFNLTIEDFLFLEGRLLDLIHTCRERRIAQDEVVGWLEYCGATEPARMGEYRTMMLTMTKSLVAARAGEISARTGGDILLQLLFAWCRPDSHPDRLLNGPTNDVWIDPWQAKLEAAGVNFHVGCEVTGFELNGAHLAAVGLEEICGAGGTENLTGYNWYISALPVEIMTGLVDSAMKDAAPSLANLDKLATRWMNGLMLYLRQDVPMVDGHSIYIDSPWGLTSVSQRQFWPNHLDWLIPGQVEGLISVDISDWETPGRYVEKSAMNCTSEEIRMEVLGEIRDHSRGGEWQSLLTDDNIVGSSVDADIYRPNPGAARVNLEPLLINTPGSWANRPQSAIEIDNLVLAADYVQTRTDLATMEGANEAGRRAVNHILDQVDSAEPRCELRTAEEPAPFSVLRYFDRDRFRNKDKVGYKRAHEMLVALGIDR